MMMIMRMLLLAISQPLIDSQLFVDESQSEYVWVWLSDYDSDSDYDS